MNTTETVADSATASSPSSRGDPNDSGIELGGPKHQAIEKRRAEAAAKVTENLPASDPTPRSVNADNYKNEIKKLRSRYQVDPRATKLIDHIEGTLDHHFDPHKAGGKGVDLQAKTIASLYDDYAHQNTGYLNGNGHADTGFRKNLPGEGGYLTSRLQHLDRLHHLEHQVHSFGDAPHSELNDAQRQIKNQYFNEVKNYNATPGGLTYGAPSETLRKHFIEVADGPGDFSARRKALESHHAKLPGLFGSAEEYHKFQDLQNRVLQNKHLHAAELTGEQLTDRHHYMQQAAEHKLPGLEEHMQGVKGKGNYKEKVIVPAQKGVGGVFKVHSDGTVLHVGEKVSVMHQGADAVGKVAREEKTMAREAAKAARKAVQAAKAPMVAAAIPVAAAAAPAAAAETASRWQGLKNAMLRPRTTGSVRADRIVEGTMDGIAGAGKGVAKGIKGGLKFGMGAVLAGGVLAAVGTAASMLRSGKEFDPGKIKDSAGGLDPLPQAMPPIVDFSAPQTLGGVPLVTDGPAVQKYVWSRRPGQFPGMNPAAQAPAAADGQPVADLSPGQN